MHTTIFDGMTNDQLQAALNNAQAAYIALASGSKGETFSYTQGDGTRSVTYTRTNVGQLTMLIRQIQEKLGMVRHARHAIRPFF